MAEREPTEATLCEQVRSGDLTAFEAFYRQHEAAVYRTALALVRDAMTAEEVVTDTFLRAHAARERLDPARPPLPWLHRIAVNLALNHLRRRRFGLEPLPDAAPWPDETAAAPERAAEHRETSAVLARGIERLPEHMRAVVVLRFVQDASLADIAETLGCPVGTVKSRLHNALRLLRADLQSELRPSTEPSPGVATPALEVAARLDDVAG